jgi:hypothetical protein
LTTWCFRTGSRQVSTDGDAFEPFEIDFVAIIPQWEVILDRNAARLSVDKIPVEMLRQIYDDMSGWSDGPDVPVVDSSALSTAETISEITRLFPSGATGQPTL